MREQKKPKAHPVQWPTPPDAKPHVKNWFRTMGSKKLKGDARKRKEEQMWREVTNS